MVFRVHKALYELKQAPKAWYKMIDDFLVEQEFVKCKAYYGVYVKNSKCNDLVLICLYVDDLEVTGSNLVEIEQFKRQMMKEFDMTDSEKLSYSLKWNSIEPQRD
jgi:hypothetical protein